MNFISKIKDAVSAFIKSRKEHKAASVREIAAHEALRYFNIDAYDGEPVITFNNVVVSIPQKNISGDQLIKTMLQLREIYIQSRTA